MTEKAAKRVFPNDVLALPVAVQLGFAFLIAIGANADAMPTATSGSVPYWIGIAIILVRRSNGVTSSDRFFAKYAFFLFIIVSPFFSLLWSKLADYYSLLGKWIAHL